MLFDEELKVVLLSMISNRWVVVERECGRIVYCTVDFMSSTDLELVFVSGESRSVVGY